jgi:hypothetical protein
MKVRITHDAIRIRLTQTEVSALGNGDDVQTETVVSENARLISIVQPSAVRTLRASLDGCSLTIDVPSAELIRWATSESITIEARQATVAGGELTLIIEKDFHCLHRESVEDVDTFPNPKSI